MSNRDNDEPERPPAEEEVGYRQPPMRRRFKDSGNPKGRPKGAKNCKTIVKMVAKERHTVHEKGKRRRRTTLAFVLLRLRNMALENKNPRAFEEFHRLIKAYQPQEAGDGLGYLVVPPTMTIEEAIAEGEKANEEARARRAARSEE